MAGVGINSWASVSALGFHHRVYDDLWKKYSSTDVYISNEHGRWAATLAEPLPRYLNELGLDQPQVLRLDPVVQQSLIVGAGLFAGGRPQGRVGVLVASARGASSSWESEYRHFLQHGLCSLRASPRTTLGNLSSNFTKFLGINNYCMGLSLSAACSSGIQALASGVAWLESKRCDSFICVASEAANTDFTFEQMRALGLYSTEAAWPCRAGDLSKERNSLVLSEGAVSFELGKLQKNSCAEIIGLGFGVEKNASDTGVSEQGLALQDSMRQALRESGLEKVDLIISHSPGTCKGDLAEYQAIEAVFAESKPLIINNKWKIGHSFGAAGAFSVELALLIFQYGGLAAMPAWIDVDARDINVILVNSQGFGGIANSIILKKNQFKSNI